MSHRTSANSTSRRALTPEELAGEYRRKAEKAQEKLDAANRDGIQQKAEIARLQRQLAEISEAQKGSKKSITTLKDACTQLEYERDHWKSAFVKLEASHESLKLKYEAIPQEQRKRNPMVSTIPDRSKRPPTASSSGSNGSGSMSSRARQQEAERLERAKREAEDARLGARFERSDRGSGTSSTARRPTTNGHSRRESFIEGYGSRKPSGRVVFDDVAHTSRYDEPVLTPRDPHVVYSHMPRTVPASSVGYHSGGSSAIVDDEFEDGNYHLRPVQ